MASAPEAVRALSPPSIEWRRSTWSGGAFDSAHRPFAREVEGRIHVPDHLLLVTLRGGARRVEVRLDDGHRFDGPDHAGAVSFLPAGCLRTLAMRDVATDWASIALSPDHAPLANCAPFTNADEPLIAAIAAELARRHATDGVIDPIVGEAAALLVASRLIARTGAARTPPAASPLPTWRLRRVREHVEAHLDEPIRIADLAALVGLSPAHFHRSFVAATAETPLAYITRRRIMMAERLMLVAAPLTIAEIALRVGFASPSHFARCFRRLRGRAPAAARRG